MSVEKLIVDLNQVSKEFEAWRGAKTGRKAIPEKLWRAAVKLLDYYPKRIVCRELKLNPSRLDKHRQSLKQVVTKREPFLELNSQALISAANKNPTPLLASQKSTFCQLLLEKKDGSRLTISLPLDWSRLERLCANLLRA
jgi:hypothetical protein